MKFSPVPFNDLTWIYVEHSIRTLFSRVVRHSFEVSVVRSSEPNQIDRIGFGDRLLSEIKRIAPKEVKIKISAPRERLYSTWIG